MKINFLGIGSAFSILEDNTSAYIKNDNKMLLIDCGETTARNIIENKILKDINELYILISHTHADHIGSLGTLLFYSTYRNRIKNKIVLPNDEEYKHNMQEYMRILAVNSEIEYTNSKELQKEFNLKQFKFLKATHTDSIPCYSFIFEDDEGIVYYSADNSNLAYIMKYIQYKNITIYTEICNNPSLKDIHLYLPYLESIVKEEDRKKVFLMHIDDSIDKKELINKGFNIPAVEKKKIKNKN